MLTASALRIFIATFLIFFFASTALATTFSGKVVKVTDGDTLQVMWNGKAEKIRLTGIDSPESGQAFGTAATRYALNQEMVRAGYAWWYRKYSTDRSLADLEDEARRNRRGLWEAPNPVPPWESTTPPSR